MRANATSVFLTCTLVSLTSLVSHTAEAQNGGTDAITWTEQAPERSAVLHGPELQSTPHLEQLEEDLLQETMISEAARDRARRAVQSHEIPSDVLGLDAHVETLPVGGAHSAATPQALPLPDGEGSIQGMGESYSASLVNGALSFSIPFALPAGRNGVTPSLSLGYSSGAGSSEVGVGWSIGVAAITRQTDRGLPRYIDRAAWHPEEDHFVYAGSQELVPVDSARMSALDGGQIPTELTGWQQYRSQVEGGFMRFFRSPDSLRWVVQSPDGTRSDLGLLERGDGPADSVRASANALIQSPDGARVASWALVRTTDAHGSTIQYVYDASEGERYLRDIYYVSPGSCGQNFSFL